MQLARRASNGETVTQLYAGEWRNFNYASQSEADAALVAFLAFYTGPCPEQLDRLFRGSGLFRPKWDETRGAETYGERTINYVLDRQAEFYSGKGIMGSFETAQVGSTTTAAQTRKVGRRLSTIQPEKVSWLWPGYIPYGKLTVLDGDPGLGKSTVTIDIAARLSTGQPMPDGAPTVAAGVVLLTAEDGMADTVVPRVLAAGGDVDRIIDASTQDEGERLTRLTDLVWLEDNIAAVDARLVIIDPLTAFLGEKVNSYNDQEIRGALSPLGKLAERTGAAIVLVRHLNKGKGSSALYRGGGSIGIIGAARSGLLIAKDPQNPEYRVLASTKSNLGAPPEALSYKLESTELGSSRVVWLGSVAYDADSLVTPVEERPQGELEKAVNFLRDALRNNPLYATDLQERATAQGIAPRTLQRAREELGVEWWKEAGVSRGHNLVGLPGQQALYLAVFTPTPYITTVAESTPSLSLSLCGKGEEEIHTSPSSGEVGYVGYVGEVKNTETTGRNAHTLPTLPTLPRGVHGQVDSVRKAPRLVTCDNPRRPFQEAMAEALWEEWYNQQEEGVTAPVYH